MPDVRGEDEVMDWTTYRQQYPVDARLIEDELEMERMREWADAHSCGNCDDFDDDGPFKNGAGICRRYSGMFQDELDLYYVDEDEYHEECLG